MNSPVANALGRRLPVTRNRTIGAVGYKVPTRSATSRSISFQRVRARTGVLECAFGHSEIVLERHRLATLALVGVARHGSAIAFRFDASERQVGDLNPSIDWKP